MILTLTPNPSTDQTLVLGEPLRRGAVQRLQSTIGTAGGKGINVSHACALAGLDTLALFPASGNDPFLKLVTEDSIPYQAVFFDGRVRTNITITEPDGTTSKLNGPGPELDHATIAKLEGLLVGAATAADWVVMAGSLPPGVPTDWYAQLVSELRSHLPHVKIAVDTSDAPLVALAASLDHGPGPDLMKPNGIELGQIAGVDGEELEARALEGDFAPVVAAAASLVDRGVTEVLVTLGAAGAVLVNAQGAWHAQPQRIEVVSTVGAGDSSLAGYVMARRGGADETKALQSAMAYGSTAASLPGTTIPAPDDIHPEDVTVTRLPRD
ncbi:1-phosphofructokinase [Corynebacterium sp. 13CS0277]|uniref:1-phosphofructokinase family hexose kinase n=1 Tax=Corynebacterium sp. 13CS0277 TaxID=2071994 RepID=UPI000D0282ED|nr:1-phosphofructokinase family hexose kinase [Corynebacterium sp. 13CS0277]PRQ10561.1 1-phosphofructokinase [Corynebacterium sp. 13CS0277]